MKNKIIIILLLSSFLLSSLFGCMQAPAKSIAGSAEKTELKLVTRMAENDAEQKLLQQAIDGFLKAYKAKEPSVNVTVDYKKDIPAKLDGYDLALMCCDDSLEYVSTQALDISTYCKADNNFSSVLPVAAKLGEYENGQYFLPFNYSRAVIYADKSAFADTKLAIPDNDWTYEQYKTLLEEICAASASKRYVGAYMPYYMPYVWKVVINGNAGGWQKDGKLLLNIGDTRTAVEELFGIYESGFASARNFTVKGSQARICALSWTYSSSPSYNGSHVISESEQQRNPGTNTEALLESGNLYMLPLPTFNGKRCGMSDTYSTFGFVVNKSSKNASAAASLTLFSQSEEGQKALIAYYGGIPTNTTLHSTDFWRKGLLSCENSDCVLLGLEGDERDDYAGILKFDSDLYDNNIRLRAIISKYLINDITYENSPGYYDAALTDLTKWFNSVTK